MADDDPSAFIEPAFSDAAIVAQAAVPASKLPDCIDGRDLYRALLGVGYAWIPCDDEAQLTNLRERVTSLGGIAPVVRGPGGLGPASQVTIALGDRLKAAFDPAGVLAAGRAWSS
jgi:hypothetical protein